MSSVYVLEPPTKGKVILNTSKGAIDIELWPKEAPKAVRNFVQLCLEGYYDSTIFHRVIKGFLVQGGDPSGTGVGGESIYGSTFTDEFHSRLRFNHRGLVACANAGSPHTNGSQFFISLDRCDWLDKKNTIFGKVTGDSVFNLLSLGEVETDKDDRPLDPPPKILSVEVLWNPFDDIVPRELTKKLPHPAPDAESQGNKKKAVKKLNLLSFGEEAEEEEKELEAVKQKIKSSHDVLDDPRLLKKEQPGGEMNSEDSKATKELQLSVREALSSKKHPSHKEDIADLESTGRGIDDGGGGGGGDNDDDYIDDGMSFDSRMREQILRKRMNLGDAPSKPNKKHFIKEDSKKKNVEKPAARSSSESPEEQPKAEKLSIRKKGIGSEARAERLANADTDLLLLNDSERERKVQKMKKRRRQGREDEVLAKLNRLQTILKAQPGSHTESASERERPVPDWAAAGLKFGPESGKDKMSRNENPNDYVVVDPLLEKGKEKFNKMMAKQKRRERQWAGKSLT